MVKIMKKFIKYNYNNISLFIGVISFIFFYFPQSTEIINNNANFYLFLLSILFGIAVYSHVFLLFYSIYNKNIKLKNTLT